MKNDREFIIIMIVLISGLVIGGFLGDLCKNVFFLSWLNYGKTIGLTNPLELDLEIIKLTFSLTIKFNICGIIGMIISFILYRKFR